MANLRWASVIVGVAATFSLLMALEGFRWWVVLPYIKYVTTSPSRGPRGNPIRTWTEGEQWDRYQRLGDLSLLSIVLLALLLCFLVGIAVGRAVPYSSGPSGAASTALAFGLLLACLLAGTLPWVFNPWANPGTRFDKLGFLTDYGMVLCYVFPFAVVSGHLGGTLGRYLRDRAAA